MLVSRKWLNNFFSAQLPGAEALAEALTFHAFEIDGIQKAGDDDILDVKVTPNRGHDCLSHCGIAKELSAILELPLNTKVDPLGDGFKERFVAAPRTHAVAVTLEDATLCPRFIAGYIQNVKVGPSPAWLTESLEAIGQRSINNIVDATNLVMFNTGAPLHAFDAGKLSQKDGKYHLVVRRARPGEMLLALDKKAYTLAERMLVVADGNADVPVGIAGIKGGEPAGITEATKDIIIECANFNSVSVRKTAQALKLRTDASSRFEQGLSPELAAYGMQNVVELIVAIAEGQLVGYADTYPVPQAETRIELKREQVHKVLGADVTNEQIANVFARLGFVSKQNGDTFEVAAPFERLDLTIAEDLVEEVGRIVGYDKVPAAQLPQLSAPMEINKNFVAAEAARERLTAEGYSEVFTSVFVEKGERAVLNKVGGDRPFLRDSLLPGLEGALQKNKDSKDLLGLKEVKLFEIGTVWKDGGEVLMLGTISEKQKAKEEPLAPAAASAYADLPLSQTERYQAFSKYPYIVRDIAVWCPNGTEPSDVEALIKTEAGELAHKISLFDRFEKGGRLSLAFRIIFQSFEKTLTEAEANDAMQKVSNALKQKGFEIR